MVATYLKPTSHNRAGLFIGLLTTAMIIIAPPLRAQPAGAPASSPNNPFKTWVGSPIPILKGTLIEIRFAGKGKKLWPSVGFTGGTDPLAAENALEAALGQGIQPSGVARRFVLTPGQLGAVLGTVATFTPAATSQGLVGIYGIQMTTRQTATVVLDASGKQDFAKLIAAMPTSQSKAAVANLSKQIYP
jgi:hypothetical protein